MQAIASLPVADLPRVTPGSTPRVTGPAGGDGEAATVLSKPAQVDPASATADVRLTFAQPTHLPVGAAVHIDIVTETSREGADDPVGPRSCATATTRS